MIARSVVIGATAVVSLCSGAALGYLYAKHELEKKYEERSTIEIAEAKRYYSMIYKTDEFRSPEEAAQSLGVFEQAVEAMRSYRGEGVEPQPQLVNHNAFLGAKVEMTGSYEDEVNSRTGDGPYVISKDDYFQGELNFEQITLTYFGGDDVLADERDEAINQVDYTVGEDNLNRFGHWSDDPRVVYIRNEQLRTDFEVLLSDGKFAVEVMGLDDR